MSIIPLARLNHVLTVIDWCSLFNNITSFICHNHLFYSIICIGVVVGQCYFGAFKLLFFILIDAKVKAEFSGRLAALLS